MSNHGLHHDWLALIEISGPFLAVPVLKEAFPQGLEELDGTKRKWLRQAYEEWREALETDDPQFSELHAAWIDEVLARGLDLDEDGKSDVLKRADWCAANLNAALPEHGVALAPDLAVIDEQRANKPLMLIHTYGQDVDLDATLKLDGWAATPADRMVQLCRATGCRLGLITNGERWMLVDAPVGAVTTFASWYARIWSQEPITLQAFVHLLGIRRFFVDEAEQLPALFDRSLKYQDEVTDALGEQVRRAVEVLIQALDKADQDRDRELLRDVKEPELYEAALTLMMRLVFLLSAEERGLLLLGDERYEANYALSTLRMQLRKESEEILERRWDAWSRLLAIFRAVFGGIEHENLRLPALGGSLFDPDRFPFLEGRAKGSDWRTDTAKPLPIDNRTVLLLLEAIQQFQGRTLSYRALDVEQIGYVYEGLLERTVKRTDEVTLELDGTKNAKAPWVKLAELESARLDGAERLAELLQERSGSSASRVRNDLAKPVDDTLADRLLAACHGDTNLRNRIKPFAHLVRTDPWGYPLVYPAGAFIVTTGSDRRETGTHYTPKSLTEAIVTKALTPIAYVGPADGTPREQWVLKSPAELLELKICDPAMGSGAFLVQACRWLADRLVEAWSQAEGSGKTVSVDGEVLDAPDTKEPLPRDTEARTVIARRLIAERCLYGVDLNPLAVELAKLSIWLVTLAKGRPFGFLDHNLRCGDSLLGIHRLDQLTELSMTPTGKGQQRLFGQNIERAVHEAIELRQRLREMPIRDIRDVEAMACLDAEARRRLDVAERLADAFIGISFASDSTRKLETRLSALSVQADRITRGDAEMLEDAKRQAAQDLAADLPPGKPPRRLIHWPLDFPEVFQRESGGFDAWVSNPPFMGGRKISSNLGDTYEKALKRLLLDGAKGSVNLVAYFLVRSLRLLRSSGVAGFIATDSITESDTRTQALTRVFEQTTTYFALSSFPWPGTAGVHVSVLVFSLRTWNGTVMLDGEQVDSISTMLEPGSELPSPHSLPSNVGFCSDGVKVQGIGFVLNEAEAASILKSEPASREVITKYIVGDDINNCPRQTGSRWVINFWTRERNEAEKFTRAWDIVDERVRPYRESLTRQVHESCFWKFWDRREAFHERIRQHGKALMASKLSKHFCLTFGDPRSIYSEKVKLFDFATYSAFAVLQSVAHTEWALLWGSTTGETPAYVGASCFDTFSFPPNLLMDGNLSHDAIDPILEAVGKAYFDHRATTCESRQEGFTAIYNLVHSSDETSEDVVRFRQLIGELDRAVIDSYGWQDIELNHAFFETKRGMRYGVDGPSRLEILRRLTVLNRERFEAAASSSRPSTVTKSKRGRRPKAASSVIHDGLFDEGAL
ncbi:Eco57I restriction-modification methylase domain-containing protein [Sedimenticola hydrogenitrophicus]|uniref:Eco57I restriction-modification methylase domain-containing protein n=1 Tax=Sedimenticola hydrogenitrophicus TaxID=2967975 RepID=UPI0023B09665|nr:type IIL restriction-modification enzyme MmeI [Sedimenticola hydrogenitrophicus]